MANRPLQINIKAIVYGIIMYIGSNILVQMVMGLILGVILTSKLQSQGIDPTDIETLMFELESQATQLMENSFFLLMTKGIELGCMFLGGFIAAHEAQTWEMTHAGIVGAIILVIFSIFLGSAYLPLWYKVIGFLLTVPASILGGYVAKRWSAF